MIPILIDTGPLVALLNRKDYYHKWCVRQVSQLKPPLYTCEAVLTEAFYLLKGSHQVGRRLNDLLMTGRVELTTNIPDNLLRVCRLMDTYRDVPMAFADACLVCLCEEMDSRIFTLDGDFRIYRRRRNRTISLLIPEGR